MNALDPTKAKPKPPAAAALSSGLRKERWAAASVPGIRARAGTARATPAISAQHRALHNVSA
jgi:hypothetical protein